MLNSYKTYKLFSLSYKLGIKPVFFIFYFIITTTTNSIKAQENLVPNGDFEEYITCPDIDAPYYYVDRATHWFMPTTGSSDYFNSCSNYFDVLTNSYLFSVPQNYKGNQEARSGYGYGGYYAVIVPLNNDYHEYMSVKLKRSLEKNKFYKLTYYVSLADSTFKEGEPQQFIDHSGAYFSNSPINSPNYYRIEENPQVYNEPLNYLNDSTGWQKIEGIFQAKGGEEYLTIGCFFKYEDVSFNFLGQPNDYVEAYYYVDDVHLEEANINFPNVFSANGDWVNDVAFQYIGINDWEIIILNRWGNVVFEVDTSIGWTGLDKNGNELPEGVYFYTVKTKNGEYIKTGFIHLVR